MNTIDESGDERPIALDIAAWAAEQADPSTIRLVVDLMEVTHPERYWFATADLMPWRTDPDVDEGAQRHVDRHEIRWQILGKILTEITGRLQRRQWRSCDSRTDTVEVRFASPEGGLTPAEARILDSWFHAPTAPRADAWQNALEDGRHRLWNVWDHDPAAWLPVRSALLDYVDSVASYGPRVAASIRETATYGLEATPPSVFTTSPLYTGELERAQTLTWRP